MEHVIGLDYDDAPAVPMPVEAGFRTCEEWPVSAVRNCSEIDLILGHPAGGHFMRRAYQSGSLRVRAPRCRPGERPSLVLLNTAGGLVQGDRLRQSIRWTDGAVADITTQAAEKVYRAPTGNVAIETRLSIGRDADAEWLPQETILFDRANVARDMQVRLSSGARFLGVEALVFGRTAMHETMRQGRLVDRWRVWRDGRLIFADALRLDGPIAQTLDRAAVGAGARALAMLIHVSDRAAALLDAVREAIGTAIGHVAASAWNGMLVTRFLARDGATLRHDMLRVLAALRDGRPMPRVWSC